MVGVLVIQGDNRVNAVLFHSLHVFGQNSSNYHRTSGVSALILTGARKSIDHGDGGMIAV